MSMDCQRICPQPKSSIRADVEPPGCPWETWSAPSSVDARDATGNKLDANDWTPRDVAALTQWQLNRHKTSKKKRTGEIRSKKTVAVYTNELAFIATTLRFQPGDPCLGILGVEPGHQSESTTREPG